MMTAWKTLKKGKWASIKAACMCEKQRVTCKKARHLLSDRARNRVSLEGAARVLGGAGRV